MDDNGNDTSFTRRIFNFKHLFLKTLDSMGISIKCIKHFTMIILCEIWLISILLYLSFFLSFCRYLSLSLSLFLSHSLSRFLSFFLSLFLSLFLSFPPLIIYIYTERERERDKERGKNIKREREREKERERERGRDLMKYQRREISKYFNENIC